MIEDRIRGDPGYRRASFMISIIDRGIAPNLYPISVKPMQRDDPPRRGTISDTKVLHRDVGTRKSGRWLSFDRVLSTGRMKIIPAPAGIHRRCLICTVESFARDNLMLCSSEVHMKFLGGPWGDAYPLQISKATEYLEVAPQD